MEPQKTPNSQSSFEKSEQSQSYHTSFNLYYKTIIIKTAWQLQKDIQTNGTELRDQK